MNSEGIKYLAMDPGDTSGYAAFDPTGKVQIMGQIRDGLKGVALFMDDFANIDELIVEDYRIRGMAANQGKRPSAIEIIGYLRGWCMKNNVLMVLQANTAKSIGEKYANYKWKGAHKYSHQWDAYSHGIYYLVKNHIRPPEGMEGRKLV